jgi:hypothetical protein
MFETLIAWIVATFLLGPLQSEMTSALEAGRAPTAVVQQVTRCVADATPRLVERAVADPWWAVTTAISASLGTASPDAVLRDAAPGCAQAFQAARPFFAGS